VDEMDCGIEGKEGRVCDVLHNRSKALSAAAAAASEIFPAKSTRARASEREIDEGCKSERNEKLPGKI